MLRICLVLVIVVALAALGFSQMVANRLTTTQSELQSTATQLQQTQQAEAKARNEARDSRRQAEDLRNQVETLELSVQEVQAKATQQETRANDLEVRLNDTMRSRNEAQERLAEFIAFGRTPQQIREVLDENQRLVVDMDAVSKENLVLDREVVRLRGRLLRYEGETLKVELPSSLKGRVLAVDPKYDFVVLNVGEDDGVQEMGEMLVNRSGKLVAKVRIMSVQSKQSIANVLPDWKQAEVMEGDVVTVGL
jgi:cell shape-determining protein MreC